MLTKIALVIFVLGITSSLFAQRERRNIVYVGFAHSSNNISIKENDKEVAELGTKSRLSPTLGYTTVPRPLWSRLNWLRSSLEFSIAPFSADHQPITHLTDRRPDENQSRVDLGTSAKGFLSYVNPTLLIFHQLTETFTLSYGIGFGIGYASISGDYFQNKGAVSAACSSATTFETLRSECPRRKFSVNDFDLSANLIAILSLGYFGIRVDSGGLGLEKNDQNYFAARTNVTLYVQYRF